MDGCEDLMDYFKTCDVHSHFTYFVYPAAPQIQGAKGMHGKLLLCRKLMACLHSQLLGSRALVLTGRLHGLQLRHSDYVE
jgi:hypothetical protein